MADWRNIADGALAVDAPIRSIDALALRDNPQAIAERATGAPRVQMPSLELLTGTGNYTVPVGVTRIRVNCIGGGGGGGGGSGNDPGGTGGNGGLAVFNIEVTPGDVIAYSCGAGGARGVTQVIPTSGSAGGSTTFGSGGQAATGGGGGGGATGGSSGSDGAGGSFTGTGFGYRGSSGRQIAHWDAGKGGGGGSPSSNGTVGQPGAIVLEY